MEKIQTEISAYCVLYCSKCNRTPYVRVMKSTCQAFLTFGNGGPVSLREILQTT